MDKADRQNDYEILQTIVAGVSASTAHAVRVALSTNTNLIIWQEGKVVEISPHDPSIA